MGTICIRDGITNQIIQEGDAVIAMILVESDDNGRSTRSFNSRNIGEGYKIASLPVHGTWNGFLVEGDSDNIVNRINSMALPVLFNKTDNENIFSAIQESLQQKPNFRGKHHCLSVIKLETLSLLGGIDHIKSIIDNRSKETEAIALQRFLNVYLKKKDKLRNMESLEPQSEQNQNMDELAFRQRELRVLSQAFSFERFDSTYLGFKLPYSAGALEKYRVDQYSDDLLSALGDHVYHLSEELLSGDKITPNYQSLQKALFDSRFISDSLAVLGLSLSPSLTAEFAPENNASLQFSKAVLFSELKQQIEICKEYGPSDLLVGNLLKEISSLKSELAASIRTSLTVTNTKNLPDIKM